MLLGRRVMAAAVAMTLAAGLAACSGGGDTSPPKAAASGSSAPAGAGSATAGQTLAPLPVIATRKTTDSAYALEVDLNEVSSRDQVMTVTFTVRNVSDGAGRWQVSDYFNNGVYDNLKLSTVDSFSADGVYVIDPKGAKRYLVARDDQSLCVCSNELSSTFIGEGQGVVFSAVFKAPEADVTTVNVYVPHAGTFTGVSLQR